MKKLIFYELFKLLLIKTYTHIQTQININKYITIIKFNEMWVEKNCMVSICLKFITLLSIKLYPPKDSKIDITHSNILLLF